MRIAHFPHSATPLPVQSLIFFSKYKTLEYQAWEIFLELRLEMIELIFYREAKNYFFEGVNARFLDRIFGPSFCSPCRCS